VKPCTVIHVRRGDIVMHGKQSRKYHAISEYLNASAKTNIQIHPNILILTDDHNAIGEAKTLYPEYHWMSIERPRWKADEGGFERQLPSNDPIFEMLGSELSITGSHKFRLWQIDWKENARG
jgi:hypothetical protein